MIWLDLEQKCCSSRSKFIYFIIILWIISWKSKQLILLRKCIFKYVHNRHTLSLTLSFSHTHSLHHSPLFHTHTHTHTNTHTTSLSLTHTYLFISLSPSLPLSLSLSLSLTNAVSAVLFDQQKIFISFSSHLPWTTEMKPVRHLWS